MEQENRQTPPPVSEIEEVPEDFPPPPPPAEEDDLVDAAPLPPTMNEFWSWGDEAELYELDQLTAGSSPSNRGKFSIFYGKLKDKLKNTLRTLQGRGGDQEGAFGRPLRSPSGGMSLADVKRNIKRVFKKETWRRRRRRRRRRREPPRGRYGGIPVSAVLGERKESKFMVAVGKARGTVKTPFTKLAELANKKKKKKPKRQQRGMIDEG